VRVLVIGSGAREHALVRTLEADPFVTEVIAAPGNGGIAAEVATVSVDVADPTAVADLAERSLADLVVVGPELPLVRGVADAVRQRDIPCFGPSAAAARLEASKAFAKEVMAAADVPTAASHTCDDIAAVQAACEEFGPPFVVKDDGLAAGKGVVVTDDMDAALAHAQDCFLKGSSVVVEEFLDGPEVSLFVLTDGKDAIPFPLAQDHKRVGDGDTGPNTGGMGAYSPLPWAPEDLQAQIMQQVAQPTIAEMRRRGTPFVGVLYCGLALTSRGLRVVEFNARFGDPEIQAVLRLLDSPLMPALHAAATGNLAKTRDLDWSSDAAVCVVVAAQGYPGDVIVGDEIDGIADAEAIPGVQVVQAGSKVEDTRLVTAGGRVLSVTAVGESLEQARELAYTAVDLIEIRGAHHRRDIGLAAVEDRVAVPEGFSGEAQSRRKRWKRPRH
jgi:phosphoribosylamine--glycine ligase